MQPPPDAKLLQIRAKHFLGEVRVRNFKQTIQIIYGKPQPKTYLPSSTLILFAIEHEMAPSDKIL
jgi:hypothetical protein